MVEKFQYTDYGMLPREWIVKSIQELLDDNSIISHLDGNHGALYPKSHEFKNYGVPYIAANDFVRGYVSFENCKYLSQGRANLFKKGIAKDGDVLFAHNATVGPVSLLKTKLDFVILSTTATYFRCNPSMISNIFLLYVMQSQFFVKQYKSVMLQSTRAQVPITAQRKFKIFVPTKTEQTAIATALNDADKLITELEKLITKKKMIKQGAMQELLKPKEGWEIKTLVEVAKFRRGTFPQPYGLDKWYDDNSGFPFVQVFDVDDNMKLKNETKRRISSEAQKRSLFVKKGSIILTIQGSIGRIAITQYDAYMDRTLLLFQDYLVPLNKYFFMMLVHLLFEQEKQKAPGGTIKTITKEALSSFPISFPSIDEQNSIAQILSDMDSEIELLEKKLDKFKMIKQSMMQNLLTGKIRLV